MKYEIKFKIEHAIKNIKASDRGEVEEKARKQIHDWVKGLSSTDVNVEVVTKATITFKNEITKEVIVAYNELTDGCVSRYQTFKTGETHEVELMELDDWLEIRLSDGCYFTVDSDDVTIE